MKSGDKKHRYRRSMIALACIICATAVIFAVSDAIETQGNVQERGHATQNIGRLRRIEADGITYVEKTGLNTILVMGIDKTNVAESYGARQGGQADFMMLIVIDHSAKKIYQLQLDRDTMAEVESLGVLGNSIGLRTMQLCLAHGFGATEYESCRHQVEAVERLIYDKRIDTYLSLNLDSIGLINDAIGGVTVQIEDDFSALDPEMTAGATVRLNAKQAELFVRSRMSVGDGTNVARMARQRQYISAALEMVSQNMSASKDYLNQLLKKLDGVIYSNVSSIRLADIANKSYNYERMDIETLSGIHLIGDDGFMEFHADASAVRAWVIKALYEPQDEKYTPSGRKP